MVFPKCFDLADLALQLSWQSNISIYYLNYLFKMNENDTDTSIAFIIIMFSIVLFMFKINEHDTDTSMDFIMYFKFIN